MGSETPLKLPSIDFSDIEQKKPDSLAWTSVRSQVRQALEEYGSFKATVNKIPPELQKAMFASLQQLFDLPLKTKLKNSSRKPYLGYIGQHPKVPLHESMGIDDAPIREKAEAFTNLLWPQGNPDFCNTILSFSEQLSELDQMIRRMVLESLGLAKYLDEHLDSTNYILRVMKYKGPQTTDTKLGLSAHTDKNVVTILYQNETQGLEVQTKSGEWIELKPSPDSFTVIIGDCFHAWTNGRLYAPHHRVMMTGNDTRYSVGLFSIPKAGYIVRCPEELVDQDHPLLFKPFDREGFLEFYYTEAGLRDQYALKTYCGV